MPTTSGGKNETLSDWKVAILCTALGFFFGGLQRTGALLFVECFSRYNVNRQSAAIPFTLSYLFVFLLGPFIGFLGNHFQIRTISIFGSIISSVGVFANFWAEDITFLSFFWGVLFGSGMVFAFGLSGEILNRHFDKHLTTAYGVFMVGSSIGAIVLTYVSKVLIEHYGLSGTFLILGGLLMNTIPLTLSLPVYAKEVKPTASKEDIENVDHSKDTLLNSLDENGKDIEANTDPQITSEEAMPINNTEVKNKNSSVINAKPTIENQSSNRKPSVFSLFSVFLNPTFIVLGITNSSFLFALSCIHISLIDYCMEKGLSADEGVYLLMVVSMMDIVGRLGLGWVADCGFIKIVNLLVGSFVLFAVTCLMFTWSTTFAMWMGLSMLYGTLFGIIISFSPKLVKDYIDPKERTMAVASRNFFFSPVAIALPTILGHYKDKVKSYDGLMYVIATLSILNAVLTFIVPHLAKRQKKFKKSTPNF